MQRSSSGIKTRLGKQKSIIDPVQSQPDRRSESPKSDDSEDDQFVTSYETISIQVSFQAHYKFSYQLIRTLP